MPRLKHPVVLARAVRVACAAALAAVGGNALSLQGAHTVGHYDFAYSIRGDRAARPVQVFDDGGGKIYFEVRPGQPMPAVFAGKPLELLVAQSEGQFYTVRTDAREFTLVLGPARSLVVHAGAASGGEGGGRDPEGAAGSPPEGRLLASAAPGLPGGVHFESLAADASAAPDAPAEADHAQPVLFAAGSARLDADVLGALDALALRIGQDPAIVIEGCADATRKPGLGESRAAALRDALVARGMPPAHIVVRSVAEAQGRSGTARGRVLGAQIRWSTLGRSRLEPAGAAVPPGTFDVLPSDHDIAGTLRRWARTSGYEFVWDVDWIAPVNGPAHLDATNFLDAVRQVAAGLRAQGYPLRAQAFNDRVVRFSTPE